MKRFILSSTLTIIGYLTVFCQANMEDIVYLKNGSEIRGTIVEWKPDSLMKVEIVGGSLIVFKPNEVSFYKKIKKKAVDKIKYIKIDKDTVFVKEVAKSRAEIVLNKGFRFAIEGGWIVGPGDNQDKSPLSIHIQSFYHVLPSTAIGVGAGLEFFNTTQAPVYIDLRQYFSKKYYAPFFFIQGGYLFPVGPIHADISGYESKGKKGYMVNPGIGFMFPLSEKSELLISFSYRYQQVKSTITDYYLPNYERIEKMNRLNVKIGFVLH